ncbi:MAG: aldehyde dehydrogenase family protein [Phormidesmis sp.]
MALSSFDLTAALRAVRQATEQLNKADHSADQRSKALQAMGQAIAQHQDDILEANTLDLEISRDMAVPDLVVDWLKLTPERVQTAASIFQRLALVGATLPSTNTEGGTSSHHTRPIGIVGFIYEAFPDLGAIAAALCIRTGNALVLKGGSEASRTNQIIASILQRTLEEVGLPPELIFPIESPDISRLDIAQCPSLDLIIPHGRPSLVEQIVKQAIVPVIPSRMGNCYLYWSASGSLEQVYQMIAQSHTGTPDAVNRIEKVLVHEAHSENAVNRLWNRLQENGFMIRANEVMLSWRMPSTPIDDKLAATSDEEWSTAYLKRTVAFRQVKDNSTAIRWINAYSSGHADSIATADYSVSRKFISRCHSAAIYINASPQFVRNARHTSEIALGASNYKGIGSGLIGMAVMQSHQRIFHDY